VVGLHRIGIKGNLCLASSAPIVSRRLTHFAIRGLMAKSRILKSCWMLTKKASGKREDSDTCTSLLKLFSEYNPPLDRYTLQFSNPAKTIAARNLASNCRVG